MSKFSRFQAGTAAFLVLGLTGGAIAPLVSSVPAFAQANTVTFTDVPSNYWAGQFISQLAQRQIIAGFPDGTFRPDAPVTRAQFSAMVRQANRQFNKGTIRGNNRFVDVPSSYWAATAIQDAYRTGFLAGYPNNVFRPEQNIPREQVLVSLANGLNYSANQGTTTVLNSFSDANNISNFARDPIAAATEKMIVVNYPNLRSLNPTRNATRAEVAAFLYQGLVSEGEAQMVSSQYVVNMAQTPPPLMNGVIIPLNTSIPIRYEREKILITKDETVSPITLNVASNINTSDGRTIIPAGSQVIGELRPVQGGSQFVAQTLVVNGRQMPITASSQVITTTETVRRGINVGTLVRNAALGTAAAAAISAVTGDRTIATEELLIGTGAGTVLTLLTNFLGLNSVELISIDTDTDLNLTLAAPLQL